MITTIPVNAALQAISFVYIIEESEIVFVAVGVCAASKNFIPIILN